MEFPLISVIAISYNHFNFLERSLDSIRNQNYPNLEVLVIDSFSSDNSNILIEDYIKKHALNNWKFFQQTSRKSICENLNFALSYISGKYYQVISCDDVILTNKISVQVGILKESNYIHSLIYSELIRINEYDDMIPDKSYLLKNEGFSISNPPPSGDIFGLILGKWYIHTLTCLFSTDSVKELGGYDNNLIFEDTDMLLRICRKFSVVGSLDVLAKHRILTNSFYNTRSIDFYVSTFQLFKKHLGYYPYVSKVRRLVSHYFDFIFLNDPIVALRLFNSSKIRDFEWYVIFYIYFYRLSKNLNSSIWLRKILLSISKKISFIY